MEKHFRSLILINQRNNFEFEEEVQVERSNRISTRSNKGNPPQSLIEEINTISDKKIEPECLQEAVKIKTGNGFKQ